MSFILWMGLMLIVIAGLFLASRRGRRVDQQVEDIASQALPEIGEIAERQHSITFGRPPTNTPGPEGETTWYPPLKKGRNHA